MNKPILLLVLFFSFSSISGEIHDAARQGDTDRVIALLKAGHDPNAPDENGFTVSDIAGSTGNTGLLEYLKNWDTAQQALPSEGFLTDQFDADSHFAPKSTFVLHEAVFWTDNNNNNNNNNNSNNNNNNNFTNNNNDNQEIVSSPKKPRIRLKLKTRVVKEKLAVSSAKSDKTVGSLQNLPHTEHPAEPVHQSTTTSFTTPATPTQLFFGGFYPTYGQIPHPDPYAWMHPRCQAYHQTYPRMTINQANIAAQYEQAQGYGNTAVQWFIVTVVEWGFSTLDAHAVVQAYAQGGDVAAWREVFLVRNPGTREWLVAYPFLTEAQSLVALNYQQGNANRPANKEAAICFVEAVRAGFSQTDSSSIVDAYMAGGNEGAKAEVARLRAQ